MDIMLLAWAPRSCVFHSNADKKSGLKICQDTAWYFNEMGNGAWGPIGR